MPNWAVRLSPPSPPPPTAQALDRRISISGWREYGRYSSDFSPAKLTSSWISSKHLLRCWRRWCHSWAVMSVSPVSSLLSQGLCSISRVFPTGILGGSITEHALLTASFLICSQALCRHNHCVLIKGIVKINWRFFFFALLYSGLSISPRNLVI